MRHSVVPQVGTLCVIIKAAFLFLAQFLNIYLGSVAETDEWKILWLA